MFAEFARDCGWLRPDRELTADVHAALRDTVRQWAGEDRVWADVAEEFVPPSMLIGGTNPFYGKMPAYVSEKEDDPIVSFHLWNGSASGSWPPDHPESLLPAVRYGDGPFRQRFTLSPEGERRPSSVTPSAR
ncbi:hypothetical protein [Streptomyces gibsoniae]|uniref:Uncharacterized protein n=1 Tax=Streptomyces gibsoniae TaxID=3075529 RepID=A0ABU2U130_9ACTN|nr:hypothetical protein [Streptomyces sp. DSM 41699]MDT0466922.1 hypothetical protein [Streptomyces sp. DSM 41699]